MDAGYRTERRTTFADGGFPKNVFPGVVFQRDPGPSALLGAVVDKPVLADIQETAAGAAVPVVRQTSNRIPLKGIEVGEGEQASAEFEYAIVDRTLVPAQGVQLTCSVMEDA